MQGRKGSNTARGATNKYLSNGNNNTLKGKNDNPLDNTNLYVKGLWKDCTQVELDDLFKPYGVICQSRVYGDGIGFVRYELPDQAAAAVGSLNGKKLHSKSIQPLIVRLAYKKIRQPKSIIKMGQEKIEMLVHENTKNVYIRGLPLHSNEADLYALCSQFGTITCIRLCKNGFAFVRFLNGSEAVNAIHGLHGKSLQNSFSPLLVKLANSDPFEPRIEFHSHGENLQQLDHNLIQTQTPNPNAPSEQLNNSFNHVNVINVSHLANSLNGLHLSPTDSGNIGNVPIVGNPQLGNQYSNTSVNMLYGNNSFNPYQLNNEITGITQQLVPASTGGLWSDFNGTITQNIEKMTSKQPINPKNEKEQNVQENEEREEEDGEIVYVTTYGDDEEEENADNEQDHCENKTISISPEPARTLEISTPNFSSNKNSISTGEITNTTTFSSPINNTSNNNNIPNNITTPISHINVNSNTNQNLNNNGTPYGNTIQNSNNNATLNSNANFNQIQPNSPLYHLNYTNLQQLNHQFNNQQFNNQQFNNQQFNNQQFNNQQFNNQHFNNQQFNNQQFQQNSGFPLSSVIPTLISMKSNTSEISNTSGPFNYFMPTSMQPYQMQSQQLSPQTGRSLNVNSWGNNQGNTFPSGASIIPIATGNPNSIILTNSMSPTTPNVNVPLDLPLLQTSNSFQFFTPNLMNSNSNKLG